MLFNSFAFVVFLPLVVATFFLTPPRFRWVLLLAASYVFYAWWKVGYLLLIVLSTVVDYWAGLQMGRRPDQRSRRLFLLVSLLVNLGLLGFFKYFNFFSTSLGALATWFGVGYDPVLVDVLLPVGISFYTFQTLAYSIDVYRGRQAPERHLGYFALYVSFFPQLVAGPIERAGHLLPQFRKAHAFRYDDVTWGLCLMAYGFFKKLVVADRLGQYVDAVFGNLGAASSLSLSLALFFFAFQIYCDFSGYSDIAIGTARILGIDLMENFRRPYLARSIREFWSRWHISLSTWFRDYLYIPLGGNRVGRARWLFNLGIVFLISGLWHGANWTFVVWGALHGAYLIIGVVTGPVRDRIWDGVTKLLSLSDSRWAGRTRALLATLITFLLVTFAWIFFRAPTLEEALYVVQKIVFFDGSLNTVQLFAGLGPVKMLFSFAALGLLLLSYRLPLDLRLRHRTVFLAGALFVILLFGFDAGAPFIYFQF